MAIGDWDSEDTYWESNYKNRPYAKGGDYASYRGGYSYGFECANRFKGRNWDDVASDLKRDWQRYEHRGQSTWENIKDAVRDAWDRVTGKR